MINSITSSAHNYRTPRQLILSCGLFLLLFIFVQCNSTITQSTEPLLSTTYPNQKHKGAHVFGQLDSLNVKPLINNNYDWITLVAYASQKDYDSSSLSYYRGDSLRMTRRDSAWKSQINLAHAAGFKVFLKPHIWLDAPSEGKWRSDIFPQNENNWQKDYRNFILYYSEIAEKNKVELFCIGAELTRLSLEQTDFWKQLIKEVRSVYSGKLTYAANWYKEYDAISFWNELDYIGVQAYFPLTTKKHPTIKQLCRGWADYLPRLEALSTKYDRQILFTELGYKSTADSAIEPWQWIKYTSDNNPALSYETQAHCYQAFFNSVWDQQWFAGVHLWQLRSEYTSDDHRVNLDFTPQGKPAEQVIAKGFQ